MNLLRYLGLLVLIVHIVYATNAVADEVFPPEWLAALKQESIAAGISEATLNATLPQLRLLPKVIDLDRAQPEFISPFLDYYSQRVDKLNVKRGREQLFIHAALLSKLDQQYGVPASQLVAFWGMETNYGRQQGSVDTFSALATLAYDGRRAGFFRAQLLDAMRMQEAGHVDAAALHGSWAGAFGHMQFMPTTFMTYAQDGDADGKIDVVNSVADAFSSAANYLSQVGWHQGELAILQVQLPQDFDWQAAQINLKKPIAEWLALGVKPVQHQDTSASQVVASELKPVTVNAKHKHNSKAVRVLPKPVRAPVQIKSTPLNLPNHAAQAAILLPQGWRGPAFMVFDNFYAILDWNRSVNYALSVAQLAQQINLQAGIEMPSDAEAGALSYQQMLALQTQLNARGFAAGEPDGFPGIQTQAAIRAYQATRQLPADGYASPKLYEMLTATTNEAVRTESPEHALCADCAAP